MVHPWAKKKGRAVVCELMELFLPNQLELRAVPVAVATGALGTCPEQKAR